MPRGPVTGTRVGFAALGELDEVPSRREELRSRHRASWVGSARASLGRRLGMAQREVGGRLLGDRGPWVVSGGSQWGRRALRP